MYQGFYNLTSQMITQNRNLNVISNNMANASTPGYKSDTFVGTSFKEEVLYRSGNKDKTNQTPIGSTHRIWASDTEYVDFTQGGLEQTENALDFAIDGRGFFAVQTENGVQYTRVGSFITDNEGYLYLSGVGRVYGADGNFIRLTTDNVTADSFGRIFSKLDNSYVGQLMVVDFQDYENIIKGDNGMFIVNEQPQATNRYTIYQGYLEVSNVDMLNEMVDMMASQRALQSAAQILKMYDQVIGKSSQIGSVE